MMYLAGDRDPDRVYVFASAAGADANPSWFHNVVAHPEGLGVEIGQDAMTADARVLSDPLRERVYDVQASRYPGFASYQARTATHTRHRTHSAPLDERSEGRQKAGVGRQEDRASLEAHA